MGVRFPINLFYETNNKCQHQQKEQTRFDLLITTLKFYSIKRWGNLIPPESELEAFITESEKGRMILQCRLLLTIST